MNGHTNINDFNFPLDINYATLFTAGSGSASHEGAAPATGSGGSTVSSPDFAELPPSSSADVAPSNQGEDLLIDPALAAAFDPELAPAFDPDFAAAFENLAELTQFTSPAGGDIVGLPLDEVHPPAAPQANNGPVLDFLQRSPQRLQGRTYPPLVAGTPRHRSVEQQAPGTITDTIPDSPSSRPVLAPHPNVINQTGDGSTLGASGTQKTGDTEAADVDGTSKRRGGTKGGSSNIPAQTVNTSPTKPAASGKSKPAPRTRSGGKGSKSGPSKRRGQGTSDDEIEKLSPEAQATAGVKSSGLTDEEKLTVIQYVTSPERWAYRQLRLQKYFAELRERFDNRVTIPQIANYWHNQAWAKYKAVCENIVKHTGGGDGDQDWYASDTDSPSMSGSDTEQESGQKRKRKLRLQEKLTGDFSHTVLLQFMNSPAFDMIHQVAHSDNSVTRDRSFNSSADISDPESARAALRKRRKTAERPPADRDVDSSDSALVEMVTLIKKRAQMQEEYQRANLELAQLRSRQEEQGRHERDKLTLLQLETTRRELRTKERAQALEMIRDTDPMVQEEGRRLLAKLRKEDEETAA